MFALRWRTLPGSYSALIPACRSYSAPQAARTRVVLELGHEVDVAAPVVPEGPQAVPDRPHPPAIGSQVLGGERHRHHGEGRCTCPWPDATPREQVGVLVGRRPAGCGRRHHDLDRLQVVDGQTGLAAEPAVTSCARHRGPRRPARARGRGPARPRRPRPAAPRDDGGSAVVAAVPQRPGSVLAGLAGLDDRAGHRRAEVVDTAARCMGHCLLRRLPRTGPYLDVERRHGHGPP